MHPALLNNSVFLKYYEQWQADPTSIVFAPIAEFLIQVGQADAAIPVCLEGLKHHPSFVMGRLALARAYAEKKETAKAKEQLVFVLNQFPDQPQALQLLKALDVISLAAAPVQEEPVEGLGRTAGGSSWETVTMAKIYASQGHVKKAQEIFESILQKNPNHEEAKRGLASLRV